MTLTLSSVENTWGIPEGFWENLYILAFLVGCISGHITVACNDKYKGADAGEITIAVLDAIAGSGRGVKLFKIAKTMMQVPDFEERWQAGVLTVMVARFGPNAVLDNPIVAAAIKRTATFERAVGSSDGVSMSVAGAIQSHYFDSEVLDLRQGASVHRSVRLTGTE